MKSHRVFWLITLLFFISGCTVYTPVYLPGEEPVNGAPDEGITTSPGRTGFSPGLLPDDADHISAPSAPDPAKTLKLGMRVRLKLKNGETADGNVVKITETALVFGKPGNYGLKTKEYEFQDLESIEVAQSSTLANVTGTFVIVAIVVLVAVGSAFASGMSRGS